MGRWLTRLGLSLLAIGLVTALLWLLYLYPEIVLAYELGLIGLVCGLELLNSSPLAARPFVGYLRVTLVAGLVIFGLIAINKFLVLLGG
ncbi:hypothetical protein [Methanoculleus taiwanensis]|uniref:hypothetical protein n=1 Tax=Methanoculleus taiwanensis TaxID=1550565 RepID=UPI000FFEB358|nr:hypothetical protein [Methanoculleus taiwanensis]